MLVRLFSRVRPFAQPLVSSLASLLPSTCALCQANAADALCPSCRHHYFAATQSACRCCALPLAEAEFRSGSTSLCGHCLTAPPAFDATIAACLYAAPVDQLVRDLKFGGQLALAPLMARLLTQAMEQLPPEARPDVLCVVPLGRQRLQERGFNQALEIARPLARVLTSPLLPRLLQRSRDTIPQALLPLAQRQHNLQHAFSLEKKHALSVSGLHVGVIDDVMTTGATLNATARLLKQSGAARVSNLVFARTPLH